MGNYLADLRIAQGLTQADVAAAVGVSEATVSRWESGAIANMRRDRIAALAEVLHASPTYIMTGSDESAPEQPTPPPGYLPLPKTKKVPLVGRIACGTPIMAEENLEGYINAPEDCHCDFSLICVGNSMIDANIHDGDIVYVRLQPTVDNGEIAVVRIGEEATLKRVYLTQDSITLIPANTAYAPVTYTGEEMREVHIEGKAIGYTHMFK
jgi:repressor LexA